MSDYTENYYKTGNYLNYLSKAERYHKLAKEMSDLLYKINIVSKDIKILDYGCAIGFLLDGLKIEGYNNIYGYDISEWAIEQASKRHSILNPYKTEEKFDISFCLDVLEHMTDDEVESFLQSIKTEYLIIRIPVSTNGGISYHLDISNSDPTHINCKSKYEWIEVFLLHNYDLLFELNLNSIYTTSGVFCAVLKKTNNRGKNV